MVAIKLDRLFRDAVDCLTATREWDRAGTTLHLVDMGGTCLNTGSAMGRMFLTMAAGFAELERNLISERTAAAMSHLKAEGRHVGSPGLGFEMVAGQLVANETEQVAVQRALELRQSSKPCARSPPNWRPKGTPPSVAENGLRRWCAKS